MVCKGDKDEGSIAGAHGLDCWLNIRILNFLPPLQGTVYKYAQAILQVLSYTGLLLRNLNRDTTLKKPYHVVYLSVCYGTLD